MEFENAKAENSGSIARVARESLSASYGDFIDEDTIDEMVEQWYAKAEIADRVGDDNSVFLVVTDEETVIAFAQGRIIESNPLVGELDWLHVAPDARGQGIGVQLLGRVQEELEERSVAVLRGPVLSKNEMGAEFYKTHGFKRADEREVEIQDKQFEEAVYEKGIGEYPEKQVVETIDGEELAGDGEETEVFVSFSETERGNKAPFYHVYRDRGLEERYAWFCGNCEALATVMDSAGRIVCKECENTRKATRWDRSYL